MAYEQITLGTLKTRLADRVESTPYWTAEEARRALNEGLRIWSAATGFWRTVINLPTVPNDPYVALPGTMVQSTRVTWNGLPLEPVSLDDLRYTMKNWRNTTTATTGAPSRPVYWAPICLSLLFLYPADAYASVAGTDALQINGIRQTPILTIDADYVDLGQEQLDVLLGYAQHVLAFKLGGQALVSTYPQWLAFLKAAALENRQFAASAFYRKLMGLDQWRRARGTEVPVASAAEEALSEAGVLADPATRMRIG